MQFELNDIVPGQDRMPDRINTVSPAVNPSMARTVYSSGILSLLIDSEHICQLSGTTINAVFWWPGRY